MAIRHYWSMAAAAVGFRLVLVLFGGDLHLASRPEVSTPLTSFRRVAEAYWLKQASMSPYSGSMYHGSPLLLSVLGPLISKRSDGHHAHICCSLFFVAVDFIAAMLIQATGHRLQMARNRSLKSLDLRKVVNTSVNVSAGDIASLIYLWNPWAIVTCVGSCTSPIENLMVVIMIYGACSRLAPLAAFGYVMATHLSLYPAILIVPVILLLGYGPDTPPTKIFLLKVSSASKTEMSDNDRSTRRRVFQQFSWKPVLHFILCLFIWSCYVLLLSSIILNKVGGLREMFEKTYGFILTVKDLSPNIGILWYFFAEVFDFFRSFFEFFLIVFNMNIVFMVLPLAIRLKHRPCFLAFVYTAIVAMLKSYPSVGDSALYLGLLGLFANELAEMQFTFLFFGYIGVSLLSPVMHNLWIWRGTGNANFYFATGLAYTCLQVPKRIEAGSFSSILVKPREMFFYSGSKSVHSTATVPPIHGTGKLIGCSNALCQAVCCWLRKAMRVYVSSCVEASMCFEVTRNGRDCVWRHERSGWPNNRLLIAVVNGVNCKLMPGYAETGEWSSSSSSSSSSRALIATILSQ